MASVSLDDELHSSQGGLIVVASLVGTLGQPDPITRYALARNYLQQMRNAVQPRPALVVGADDVP
jgi:hypothetical protein